MSQQTNQKPDEQKPMLRVEIRIHDGWAIAAVQLGPEGSPWMVLAQVRQQAYEASPEVQRRMRQLAQAVMRSAAAPREPKPEAPRILLPH